MEKKGVLHQTIANSSTNFIKREDRKLVKSIEEITRHQDFTVRHIENETNVISRSFDELKKEANNINPSNAPNPRAKSEKIEGDHIDGLSNLSLKCDELDSRNNPKQTLERNSKASDDIQINSRVEKTSRCRRMSLPIVKPTSVTESERNKEIKRKTSSNVLTNLPQTNERPRSAVSKPRIRNATKELSEPQSFRKIKETGKTSKRLKEEEKERQDLIKKEHEIDVYETLKNCRYIRKRVGSLAEGETELTPRDIFSKD